jgi:hypothetical protein
MDFAAVVYLSESQNSITPRPLHNVYMYTVYFFTQGKGGGGFELEKSGERGNISQSWVKNTNMTDCISSL